jgi:hypothetical protein
MIALQQDCGVDVITDGEMRRTHFIAPLTDVISGVKPIPATPPGSTRSKTGLPGSSAMSLHVEFSPRSGTWPASSCATSVTTTALPSPSSGPTVTSHTASALIPFLPLQATSGLGDGTRSWASCPSPQPSG